MVIHQLLFLQNKLKLSSFKINNKSKKDTNYKVGYIGNNVKITYDSKDSDPLEGTIEKESMNISN